MTLPSVQGRANHERAHAGPRRDVAERFWAKVAVKYDSTSCWEWQGAITREGYGWFRYLDRSETAHRVMWGLAEGPIPDGLWVLHHCDNRRCVRPSHLYVGTVQDNQRDLAVRRRARNGSGGVRFTLAEASAIRAAWLAGATQVSLARQYGVSPSTIGSVVHGKNTAYANVPVRP